MNITTLLMFGAIIVMIFYMQSQQKKQAQKAQEERNSLVKGDEIVTIGGMYAIVDEVDLENNRIVLDVDGVYLTFELGAIKRIVTKSTQQATVVEESVLSNQKQSDSELVAEETGDGDDAVDEA